MTEKELSELLTEKYKGKVYDCLGDKNSITPWDVAEDIKKILLEKRQDLNITTEREAHSASVTLWKAWANGRSVECGLLRVEVKRQKGEKIHGAFSSWNKWFVKEIKVIFYKDYDNNDVDDLDQTVEKRLKNIDEGIDRRTSEFSKNTELLKTIKEKCKELGLNPREAIDYIDKHWYRFDNVE